MEPLSWALWQLVRCSGARHHLASAQLQIFARGLTWMDQYDVIVAPALAEAPVLLEHRSRLAGRQSDGPLHALGAFTPFTAVANVTGQPAIATAAGWSTRVPRSAAAQRRARRSARRRDALEAARPLGAATAGAVTGPERHEWPRPRRRDRGLGVIRSTRELRLDDGRVAAAEARKRVGLRLAGPGDWTVTRTRWVATRSG